MSSTKNTKKCRDCGEVKPIEDFYKKSEPRKWFSNCKKCYILMQKAAKKDLYKKSYDHRKIIKGNRGKAKLLAFWQSIPAAVKDAQYFERSKNVKIGDEEEAMIPELLKAKTLGDIAKVLGVRECTVRKWQKTKFVKRYTDKFDEWNNVMRFKKDIDYAFTQKTIQHADKGRVQLWYELYCGWVPKSSKVHELDEDNIVKIQKRLRELGKTPEGRQLKEPEKLKDYINVTEGDYEDSGSDSGGFGEGEGDSEDPV